MNIVGIVFLAIVKQKIIFTYNQKFKSEMFYFIFDAYIYALCYILCLIWFMLYLKKIFISEES